ncbi:MAG TPA: mechanosensitive ion channel domain-containing protein, partial [Gemmatimonadales bacterium]|nr:mechanosensitive ion channel domain-containing protein [Gemmatimonadales bacterium]
MVQNIRPSLPTVRIAAAVAWILIVAPTGVTTSGAAGVVSASPAIAQPGPPVASSPPAVAPIPVPEIAQRAEQVSTLLQTAGLLPSSSEDRDNEAELTAAAQGIQRRLVATAQALASAPSPEAGDLPGQVREIGGRASTIRTWDGAEVIVPNSTLTSQQVTNWTLSDRLRRVVVPVGVTY